MSVNIIGISALYHNSSCCLLQDGELKLAVEEERFTRIKHDSSMPCHAFTYCLKEARLSINEIDVIAYYEVPKLKQERQIWSGYNNELSAIKQRLNPNKPEKEIRNLLGYDGKIEYFPHHLSHAASSYYYSGFEEAAILTIDGVGEWATTTYGYGQRGEINIFEEVNFPHSIGLLYAAITSYLGFKVNSGEYKVMGLAPYGDLKYVAEMESLLLMKTKGQYELNMDCFDFVKGEIMYSPKMQAVLGIPPRKPESDILQCHKDIARSLQFILEKSLVYLTDYLYKQTNCDSLCLAGGVALNCAANGALLDKGCFKNIFIQPAANDAGGSIGAAALAYHKITGQRVQKIEHVYLGPKYDSNQIKKMLINTSLNYADYEYDEQSLLKRCAQLIMDGKVIGWFDNRMEFGARALGCRSILADPRDASMRDRINKMVKKRESFRPFAPSVLEDHGSEHFNNLNKSPYMLFTYNVISSLCLPAITHVNNSARVQTVDKITNPKFYALIYEFYNLTGCPILLNTSFNVRGEPIVMSPLDAIRCFLNTSIDYLAIGTYLIPRDKIISRQYQLYQKVFKTTDEHQKQNTHDVYTFI